ncbi:Hypothetical protein, putative, partial [Bodo saltans]
VVKMLLDAWELWSAVRRRVHSACGCLAPLIDEDHGGETSAINAAAVDVWIEREDGADDAAALTNAARKTLLDVEKEAAETIAFDDIFWDDNGQAIGTAEAEDMNEILTTVVKE